MPDWLEFFFGMFPKLLEAVPVTLALVVIAGVFGNLLAVPVALARVSPNPVLRTPAYLYILLMRGTPLLVQIYFLYRGVGEILAASPAIRQSFIWPYLRDGFWYAAVALSLNTAGYSGEILRGAIQAVPHGEVEAARAFGMSRWLMLRRVILPRAIRISLPTFSGEAILLLKSTALASTVTVMDVFFVAKRAYSQSFLLYESLLPAAIIYIVLTFIITRAFYFAERQLNKDRLPPKSSPAAAVTAPAK
jgi:His/Glu/Gln/Arg/opine family amino acid ABC transporter permease subunit